jgi:hypothetical protein
MNTDEIIKEILKLPESEQDHIVRVITYNLNEVDPDQNILRDMLKD